ncbi:MAG: histidine kinase N-terminal 7TM domain-containing protein [Halobellus sp.]|uniref:histidine kinase N-terminal 7TM domain-containing protein n=1 Tax=Halobellus sp. TaxID=1979212 RepID=UPI0035D4D223
MALPHPLVLVLFLSVAVGTSAAILAWRQRPEPGATPLVGLLVGQAWWSACISFKLQAATLDGKVFWTELSSVGVGLIPFAWTLFALEYTGNDQFIRPWIVSALSVVPIGTVLLALTSDSHSLLFIEQSFVGPNGVIHLQMGGVWYWVIAAYTYFLGAVGTVPLLGTLRSGATAIKRQGAILLLGVFAPWLTNGLFLAGVFPRLPIDPTPIAFSISGVAYLYAISRHRLFETSPTPTKRARQYLFDQMDEGAVVVDRNDYVVYANDVFFTIVEGDRREILGAPASEYIPEYETVPSEGNLDGVLTIGDGISGRAYDVRVTSIVDIRDRPIGRVITFHDISEYRRQQQRLKVLNRVLRHNMRTETNVIHGYADQFSGDEAEIIQERAMRIDGLGEKGRQAIELFDLAHEPSDPLSLAAILEQAVDTVRRDHAVRIDIDPPSPDVEVAFAFRYVFTNLLENAAAHYGDGVARISVDVDIRGDSARVSVVDEGPGIDESEVAVLESGTETALEHGSGLGLWIVKWGVDIADGAVEFRENEPTGTQALVDVPIFGDVDAAASDSGSTAAGAAK